MLAYAPRRTARSGSPRTLLLVAAGHVVALALVLTAKSDLGRRIIADPTDVIFVPTKLPPPPPPSEPTPRQAQQSVIDTPPIIIPTPLPPIQDAIADGPPVTNSDPVIGNAVTPQPAIFVPQPTALVRRAARFATPADLVEPPYPAAKQRLGESASLRLTLAIDARGRVTSVSPVGNADPIFLAAAQRHILRHWRYQPAQEGETAVASSLTITLRFRLED